MRKFLASLSLSFFLLASFAHAQQNAPITQLQNGSPAQANDQVHVARCNFAGCDYRDKLGGQSVPGQIIWNNGGIIDGLNPGANLAISGNSLNVVGFTGGGYQYEQIVSTGTTATVSQVSTFVIINSASTGAKTITIPTSTGSKQVISIEDYFGNAYTYPITAVPVSGSINGNNQVYTNAGSISLYDSSIGWISF